MNWSVMMILLYPLKPFERIWDRIEKSKGISRRLKSFLLTLVTLIMLIQSIGTILLLKQVTSLIGMLLGYSPP